MRQPGSRRKPAPHPPSLHSGTSPGCAGRGERTHGMTEFIIPLSSATAADADRIGPKAANLAALARAGLPTPGGFCLSADAYRAQIAALGAWRRWSHASPRPTWCSSAGCRSKSGSASTSSPLRRTSLSRCSRPGASQRARERRPERGALLRADRGPQGREFRRPVRKLPRHRRRGRVPHRGARVLGGAVDHQCAPLHGASRAFARRYRHGGADPAAGQRARLRRRPERDGRRPDADQRDLGARLGDRAGRGRARPHRALAPGIPAHDRSRPQGSSRDLRPRLGRRPAGGAARTRRASRASMPDRR